MHEPFRIEPAMPASAYKTYTVAAPLRTHFRVATCAEVGCPDYLNGWRVRVEGLPAALLHAARTSGRRYRELSVTEGETWLVFEAGQECFKASQHRTRVDRAEIFIVRDGDYRGNPRGTDARVHHSAADWVDDFANHQDRLKTALERG